MPGKKRKTRQHSVSSPSKRTATSSRRSRKNEEYLLDASQGSQDTDVSTSASQNESLLDVSLDTDSQASEPGVGSPALRRSARRSQRLSGRQFSATETEQQSRKKIESSATVARESSPMEDATDLPTTTASVAEPSDTMGQTQIVPATSTTPESMETKPTEEEQTSEVKESCTEATESTESSEQPNSEATVQPNETTEQPYDIIGQPDEATGKPDETTEQCINQPSETIEKPNDITDQSKESTVVTTTDTEDLEQTTEDHESCEVQPLSSETEAQPSEIQAQFNEAEAQSTEVTQSIAVAQVCESTEELECSTVQAATALNTDQGTPELTPPMVHSTNATGIGVSTEMMGTTKPETEDSKNESVGLLQLESRMQCEEPTSSQTRIEPSAFMAEYANLDWPIVPDSPLPQTPIGNYSLSYRESSEQQLAGGNEESEATPGKFTMHLLAKCDSCEDFVKVSKTESLPAVNELLKEEASGSSSTGVLTSDPRLSCSTSNQDDWEMLDIPLPTSSQEWLASRTQSFPSALPFSAYQDAVEDYVHPATDEAMERQMDISTEFDTAGQSCDIYQPASQAPPTAAVEQAEGFDDLQGITDSQLYSIGEQQASCSQRDRPREPPLVKPLTTPHPDVTKTLQTVAANMRSMSQMIRKAQWETHMARSSEMPKKQIKF